MGSSIDCLPFSVLFTIFESVYAKTGVHTLKNNIYVLTEYSFPWIWQRGTKWKFWIQKIPDPYNVYYMGLACETALYNDGSFTCKSKGDITRHQYLITNPIVPLLTEFLHTWKIPRCSDRESNPCYRAHRQTRNQLSYPDTLCVL